MAPIELTKEQTAILNTCQPPDGTKARIIRVTAAAGSGKTTTLLALAKRAVELGHQSITYLTFSKAAAQDGQRRIQQALRSSNVNLCCRVKIDARTLHSCALAALNRQFPGHSTPIWGDKEWKKWISLTLHSEIESFLRPCYNELARRKKGSKYETQQRARDRVEHFLLKTFEQFCRGALTLKELEDRNTFGRDYYPATQFHTDSDKSEKLGFLPSIYGPQVHWYADRVLPLWEKIVDQDLRTFDIVMKRVQLSGLKIPGTIILMDESQDMDACQIDWAAKQPQTLLYFVGDAAQTIYGFRGAKSKYLMGLPIDTECQLTESWRFGSGIAHIANLVLFAKEYSDQTSQENKSWSPYRVTAGREKESIVTDQPLLPRWREYKARSETLTLIARENKTLMDQALCVLGFSPANDEKETIGESKGGGIAPRIHINGFGSNSGRKAFSMTFQLVGVLGNLYNLSMTDPDSPPQMRLQPSSLFPEFAGQSVSWKSFCEEVEERELTRYGTAIAVVEKYQENAIAAVDFFKQEVIEKNYQAKDADIILTTCHSAKGMEWDHVQVANDFIQLANYKPDNKAPKEDGPSGFAPANDAKRQKVESQWKFGFPKSGDDVNLAYVACTRAKHTLSLPACVLDCIRDFDKITEWLDWNGVPGCEGDDPPLLKGAEDGKSPQDIKGIHDCLVRPFQEEVKAPKYDPLMDHLLNQGAVDFGSETPDNIQRGEGASTKVPASPITREVTPDVVDSTDNAASEAGLTMVKVER